MWLAFYNLNIKALILKCLECDRQAQKELVCHFAPSLLTVSKRYISGPGAEDVLQEAFIKIFKHLDSFDVEKGSLEAWMKKIVVNTALNILRKKNVLKQHSEIDHHDVPISPEIYKSIDAEEIVRLIASLPTSYRTVFNLYAVEGYSHKEIGEMLGCAESSSRSNLARARQLLKKSIYENKNFESWQRIV